MAEQGGLLSFLNSPTGMGLLSAVGAGLAGARRGGPLNALGTGLLGGVQGYAQAQETQALANSRSEQADWLKTQRDWMSKDRARAEADRAARESWLQQATTPQPILQPSAAPQSLKDVNPYTDPSFIYGTARLNNLPGVEKTPMGVQQINPLDAVRNKFSPEEAAQLSAFTAPKKPNLQTFKPGDVVRNMDSGELVFQAPEKPAEAPSAVREYEFARGQGFKGSFQDWVMSQKRAGAPSVSISMGQKGLDNEFKLRDAFKAEPVYKAHQEMDSAYRQIKQSLSQATPAGDLAGATKIMKLLDPGSVVRESELGMAMQASGLMDRASNYANMVITGQKLTPQQRIEFQKLADALYGESVTQFNSKRSEYERLGGEYGLNSGRALGPAVQSGGQGKPQPSQTPQGKPSVSNW